MFIFILVLKQMDFLILSMLGSQPVVHLATEGPNYSQTGKNLNHVR